ncbi:alpha/beta fold hydrolase [Pseudomonas silvicola]|nr:alpha/beta fold hydrolase [Pseudomonas silvicola]
MTIKCGYVDTEHGQIHYRFSRASSSGAPTVVYLHKSASSSRMFEATIVGLASDYNGYALDMPGFGQSFDPQDVPAIAWYVDIFIQALDRLNIERFHLVGHHTGGCIAGEMAVLHPKRVLSMTMIGPTLLSAEEREQFRSHYSTPFNKPLADGSHLQLTWDYLRRMGVGESLALHQRECLDHARAWHGRTQAYRTVWDQDFIAHFLQVQCPMLALCATDDVLWLYFQRVRQLRPEVSCEVIRGANFEPDLDAPSTVSALRGFLAGCKSRL